MKRYVALLIALVALLPAILSAETVDVGGVKLEIPAPNGYTSITGEDALFEVWKKGTHTTSTLLAGFMFSSDYKDWVKKRDFDYGFYNAFVEVDQAMKSLPANAALFNALVKKVEKQLTETLPPAFVETFDGKMMLNPDLMVDDVGLVSFEKGEGWHTNVMLTNNVSENNPMNATAQVLVGGRIIDLSMEAYYKSQSDVASLKRSMAAWVDAVTAANE